jgi:hypothetical protein
MSLRLIITLLVFSFIFFGLMTMVGNVHVVEFYGILTIALIASIVTWFKLGKFESVKKVISTEDFNRIL